MWVLTLGLGLVAAGQSRAAAPHIVWVTIEDMSPHFSCYGETTIQTPVIDQLARQGILFTRAFTTAPICSTSRSALITGCYQTAIGCQNHRSSSSRFPILLPSEVRLVPQLLRDAGYHTTNLNLAEFLQPGGKVSIAKTDYNFQWEPADTYATTHWEQRAAGQPFFTQVQLHGGKYRGQAPRPQWPKRVQQALGTSTDPDAVHLPPYLPDDPVIRADWAQYLDTVRYTDWEIGQIVERLKAAGVWDQTVLIIWTDHGISHVRNKQFLYEGGIWIPLVIRLPQSSGGTIRDDLVEHIDIAAITLSLAGLPLPEWMHGRNILAADYSPRMFVFSARDRADETVDRIRAVRSTNYKYIRNFFPDRPYLQPNAYKDDKAIVQVMRALSAKGRLDAAQALIMAERRPREELYALDQDPYELKNLADDPMLQQTLAEHRTAILEWEMRHPDLGSDVEPTEVYLDYVLDGRPEGGRTERAGPFGENIDLMLRWAVERPMRP